MKAQDSNEMDIYIVLLAAWHVWCDLLDAANWEKYCLQRIVIRVNWWKLLKTGKIHASFSGINSI